MFTRIMVPLDGSENSKKALETAINVAKKFDGEITLINVYSTSLVMSLTMYNEEDDAEEEVDVTSDDVSRMVEAVREERAEILAEGKKKVEAEGVPVETLLREGHVAQEILKTARDGRFDVIVLGAKGVSRIKEMLLGSVSEKVVRNAPCTVIVVK